MVMAFIWRIFYIWFIQMRFTIQLRGEIGRQLANAESNYQ